MNAEADRYVQACEQERLNLGSAAAARLHALQNLKLKTAVKVVTGGSAAVVHPITAAACIHSTFYSLYTTRYIVHGW